MKKVITICLLVFVLVGDTRTQDMQFTQYWSAPMYLNPSLAGFNVCSRVTGNVRNQWPAIGSGYVSQLFSIDHYFVNHNIGSGLLIANDYAGAGKLRTLAVYGLSAYELNVSRDLTFRFGMQGGFIQRSVNMNDLLFADQIARGGNVPTLENAMQKVFMLDFATGGMAFYKNYFAGMAIHHLSRPDETLLEDEAIRPSKFSIHGGAKFKIGPEVDDEEKDQMYLTPTFNYRAQLKYDQLDIGLYYSKYVFNIGVWYRGIPGFKSYKPGYPNNDALCFIFGISKDRLNVGYSFDATISWLRGSTGGAHELSLAYQFCKLKRKKKKRVTVICPKF
jgi:type IX secretion system PorP/SprF family membrane protein